MSNYISNIGRSSIFISDDDTSLPLTFCVNDGPAIVLISHEQEKDLFLKLEKRRASRALVEQEAVLHDLGEISRFDFGWDGYTGSKFTPEIVERVFLYLKTMREYFSSIARMPDDIEIGPASDGSIDLELTYSSRVLVMTLSPDNDLTSVFTKGGDDYKSEEVLQERYLEKGMAQSIDWLLNYKPVPKLSDPCPRGSGRHSIYINSGPGGKRSHKEGWQCCDSCGANGPYDGKIY